MLPELILGITTVNIILGILLSIKLWTKRKTLNEMLYLHKKEGVLLLTIIYILMLASLLAAGIYTVERVLSVPSIIPPEINMLAQQITYFLILVSFGTYIYKLYT